MEKIVLIEPKTKKGHVYSATRMPRLGLPLLGAKLKAAGYDPVLYMAPIAKLPWANILQADLVGISTTTSTCQETYKIAGFLRAQGVPVVIGGIHATYMPEEALQYCDYVVRGEADNHFLPLVDCLAANNLPIDIPGVSFRNGEEIVHNPCSTEPVILDEQPFPDLSLFAQGKPSMAIPIMTSRGCPFNCTFCSVTQMFGRKYRFRSTENILQELSRYRGSSIFFCDDNFTADLKRTKQLLQGMLDNNIRLKSWGAQMRVEAAKDPELLELMNRTGGDMVYVGLESINPATLEAYNKKQTVDEIRESIKLFHQHKIRVHGMFVFGSDADTVQTIRDTVDFALETRIDTVQFLMLTPIVGTNLYNKLEEEGRLLTKEWELYDGHHAVFQPALMSPEELQEETFAAFRKFYALRNIFQNYFYTGWGSSFYRGLGWLMVKRFNKQNLWYDRVLQNLQQGSNNAVRLLDCRIHDSKEQVSATAENMSNYLKIYLTETNGVFYLQMQGFLNRFTMKELKRSLKNLLPKHCFHLVVNTEELHFISEKYARSFSRFLEKLGRRSRRLQLIYLDDSEKHPLLKRYALKIPKFELFANRR